MIKTHKKLLIVTSIIILLPTVAGLILWDRLPQEVPTHWGFNGQPDDYASREVAVFLLPLLMLAVQWLCVLAETFATKNKHQNPKLLGLVLWICPLISTVCMTGVYAWALGYTFPVERVIIPVLGILFCIIGNYMPKCRPNRTMGIRIPWTMLNEATWVAAHRLTGWIWTLGGILILPCALLPHPYLFWCFLGIVLVMTLVPIVYSAIHYYRNR